MDWDTLERLPTLGAAEISREGILLRANAAFGLILGDDVRYLTGRHLITDLTGVVDRERASRDFDDLIRKAVDSIVHVRTVHRPDGTSVSASFVALVPQGEQHVLAFMWRQPTAENCDQLRQHINQLENLLTLVLKTGSEKHGVTFNVSGSEQQLTATDRSEINVGSKNMTQAASVAPERGLTIGRMMLVCVGLISILTLMATPFLLWLVFHVTRGSE